jgi:hypothetical protein
MRPVGQQPRTTRTPAAGRLPKPLPSLPHEDRLRPRHEAELRQDGIGRLRPITDRPAPADAGRQSRMGLYSRTWERLLGPSHPVHVVLVEVVVAL